MKGEYVSSTEVLTKGSHTWVMTNPLPRPLGGPMGVSVGGRLHMTGK